MAKDKVTIGPNGTVYKYRPQRSITMQKTTEEDFNRIYYQLKAEGIVSKQNDYIQYLLNCHKFIISEGYDPADLNKFKHLLEGN